MIADLSLIWRFYKFSSANIHKLLLNYIPDRRVHKFPLLLRANPNWGTNKQHRRVKLFFRLNAMADPKIEEKLSPFRASVKEQVNIFVPQLTVVNLLTHIFSSG